MDLHTGGGVGEEEGWERADRSVTLWEVRINSYLATVCSYTHTHTRVHSQTLAHLQSRKEVSSRPEFFLVLLSAGLLPCIYTFLTISRLLL